MRARRWGPPKAWRQRRAAPNKALARMGVRAPPTVSAQAPTGLRHAAAARQPNKKITAIGAYVKAQRRHQRIAHQAQRKTHTDGRHGDHTHTQANKQTNKQTKWHKQADNNSTCTGTQSSNECKKLCNVQTNNPSPPLPSLPIPPLPCPRAFEALVGPP